jgi:sporulation protein YlmC with PRC-barrel domain
MKSTMHMIATGALGLSLAVAMPAHAQQEDAGAELEGWNYAPLYEGWRASVLSDADAYNQDGEAIGEVEDLIFGPDGTLRKFVVEAGGFLNIGDTHFAVAADQAEIEGIDRVTVQFDRENIEDYSIFEDIEGEPAAGRNWRASELIGDFARFENGERWGLIEDIIISREGEIKAVVIGADVASGFGERYAFPFRGFEAGFDPANDYYATPYTRDEVAQMTRYDYEAMDYPNVGP